MTSTIFVFVFCVVLLASSTYIQGDPKWCPNRDVFVGGPCEGNSSTQCLLDVSGKYGASSMPKNCRCRNLGSNKRLCNCQIVCH
ncbi:hypothetical protein JCGZ_25529 [Jatropha curcas]|uniref:Uncharacterized protein n=1 Tax=Jatropha curcas TaxID=180498 RepID=A0A067JP52_JATCU|nr:hypothetical protein JCGZ_25529 [Jatropha curcas]